MKIKKRILVFVSILALSLFLAITPSCAKSEEDTNEEILQNTTNLLTYNWQLNNIRMTYEDYKKEVSNYFVNKNTFDAHIKYNDLNPIIIEDVTKNNASLIKKYKSKKNYNYDLLNIEISKIYGEETSINKYCYIHIIISPHIPLQKDMSFAYVGTNYTLKEERNILVKWTKEKSNWKISDIQGNAYLLDLKDKLSTEFINRYTYHNNTPVEYIHQFELVH